MNKITSVQLAGMLLISDVFALFCLTGSISLVTAGGFVVGTAVQFLMALPLAALYKKGGQLGKPSQAICLVWLIFWGGSLFAMQWRASEVIYIPLENSGEIRGKLIISGLIALVCLYISSEGIKALARASVIAAAVGAFGLAVVIVTAFASSSAENLERAASGRSFLGEMIRGAALSGGTGGLTVLLAMTKGDKLAGMSLYFFGKAVISAAVTLTAVLVAGGIMQITDFPIVTASQLTQPFSVQRIDSLFLINFAVFAVFATAVQSAAAAWLAGQLFPRFKRWRCTCILALMIGTALVLPENELLTALGLAAVLFLLPLLALLRELLFTERRQSS